MVHVDQLHRPMKMTDGSGSAVWSAVYSPFGGAYTLSGSETLNARFPGQWFQLEAGLHYNWHRHYDPTLGRYTQPDPLGFVDGPSVFSYARLSPNIWIDQKGLRSKTQSYPPGYLYPPDTIFWPGSPSNVRFVKQCMQFFKNTIGSSDDDDRKEDRCKAIIRSCFEDCKKVYDEDLENLPGSGNNYQPRLVRCVRDCAAEHGCSY